jgi:FkbM family methyltransferase
MIAAPHRGLGRSIGRRDVAPSGVIHVGGHHGEEAAYYVAHGVADVVWFEADPDAFAQLVRNTARFAGHRCVAALAADVDGDERLFYRHRFPGGTKRGFCSTFAWNTPAVARDPVLSRLETFDVRPMRTVTVATALRERGFAPSRFQYLSLNVQGAELLVLRGLGEYLAALDWIFCDGEPDGGSRYAGAPTIGEVAGWLAPRGFRAAWAPGLSQQLFYRPLTPGASS